MNARRPAVSVIIPAWNAERTIERAIASVLDEYAVPLECIVVDDGSTDDTAVLVAAIADGDPRVVLIRSADNEGVSAALNRALDVAQGEWLTFLGADDRLLSGAIAVLVAAAQRTNPLVVIGQRVWSNGERTWVSSFYDIPDIREPGRKSLVSAPGLVYYASATGKLFHRSVTTGLRFSGRVLGDQPWTIRALLRAGDRVEVIGETVYEWTRTDPHTGVGSITTTTRSSAQLGVEAVAVAEAALADVRREAERQLADREARRVVTARYVERLLRSDLGMHLFYAVRRCDPATASLMAAIERFIKSVPPELLAASDALARDILERPLRRWTKLPRDAHTAYWSLFTTALRADPDLPYRERRPLARLALLLVSRDHGWIRRLAATVLLLGASLATALQRRLRALRRMLHARVVGPVMDGEDDGRAHDSSA